MGDGTGKCLAMLFTCHLLHNDCGLLWISVWFGLEIGFVWVWVWIGVVRPAGRPSGN